VAEQLLAKGLVTKQSTLAARQKLTTVQGQVETLKAQLKQYDAQEFSQQSAIQQAAAEMESRSLEMERNLASVEKELSMEETVVSPYGGEVIEVKVSPGGTVGQNTPILSIQPDLESLEVLIYLPSLQAKDAKIGMEVQISPSTVRREEFGYMRGSITYVASYPATPAALMRNFQNEALVTSLTSAGPVTELRVALERDPAAVSGFRWSSPNSPPVKISSGTLCDAEVVTQRQKPITLVIPLFKQKLGLG
jgi:HlyD family secretion protein